MKMTIPMYSWVAMCFLAIRVSALPQAAAASAGILPPGPIVNVTQQTPITEKVSIMTSLIISDKSGCDSDQIIAINQAYLDALNLVGTVGGYNGPGYLYASTRVPPYDYFGAFLRHTDAEKSQIMSKLFGALIDCFLLTDKEILSRLKLLISNGESAIGGTTAISTFFAMILVIKRVTVAALKDQQVATRSNRLTGTTVDNILSSTFAPLSGLWIRWPHGLHQSKRATLDSIRMTFGAWSVKVRSCQPYVAFMKPTYPVIDAYRATGSAFLHEMFHTSATASGVSSPRCKLI